MQLVDGRLVRSASDLVGFLECEHLLTLDRAAARGSLARPARADPELDLLAEKGLLHEHRFRDALLAEGRRVVEIARPERELATLPALHETHARTEAAIREGADAIYQAAFFDGRWLGYADFLLRVEVPSLLGSWSYEVADTKLARRVKSAALLQLCSYAEHLERIQGRAPEHLIVVTGDRVRHPYPSVEHAAYFRAVKRSFDLALDAAGDATYPEPVGHCEVCRWSEVCEARRRADDHLSLVAGLTRDQTRKLRGAGVGTVAGLAATDRPSVPRIGAATYAKLRGQATLQVEGRADGVVRSALLPLEPHRGLALLPEPVPGDLFFDMEGDPWAEDDGLEYLFGVTEIVGGAPVYETFWARDRAEEKIAFERFIDHVMERLAREPALHVYHYAAYERTKLTKLMQRHATREEEVDALLRGGILVDLYQVVRQAVQVSQESYSIKKLEPLYLPAARGGAIQGGAASVVAFERWLDTRDQRILDEIGAYNALDCESTWRLRDWLEGRRRDAERALGVSVARPEPPSAAPPAKVAAEDAEVAALAALLTADLPGERSAWGRPERARWLLAQLLSFHRREQKPEWWEYFRRLELSDEELADDPASLAPVTFVEGSRQVVKQSFVHSYEFDPAQEHKFKRGDAPIDPHLRAAAGTVESIDNTTGRIALKKGKAYFREHPVALVPEAPQGDDVLREALRRVARAVVDRGIDGDGPYRAARALLGGGWPTIVGAPPGAPLAGPDEDGLAAARRLAPLLRGTVLGIQGPPGSGKTFTGAEMLVDLVAAGKRVGVTASSHRAITNLVRTACERAAARGVGLRVVQRGDPGEVCDRPEVTVADSPRAAEEALAAGADVVAGTAWLFARDTLERSVDVLFVDEAGQLSLANAVAVGGAADSLVLLGDPNQLDQPTKGVHPPGAGVSALAHVLGDARVMPAARGLFLGTTWRLHPDVCGYVSEIFYAGRLAPHPDCARQGVGGIGRLGGTGLRYAPVPHEGARTTSPAEVERVAGLVAALLRGSWTDRHGVTRPLTAEDILVVAPYNAHVARLGERLPGVRVGTVDRFQGQEAPVVIYSMATSTREDMPRGMEFLYSWNRLNVAVSRAQGLAILVQSPALLRVRCHTPEQMRLANALCRFVEMATEV